MSEKFVDLLGFQDLTKLVEIGFPESNLAMNCIASQNLEPLKLNFRVFLLKLRILLMNLLNFQCLIASITQKYHKNVHL